MSSNITGIPTHVPDGFWALLIANSIFLVTLTLFISWLAAPKKCCKCFRCCCCQWRKNYRYLANESNKVWILAGYGQGNTTEGSEDNDYYNDEETKGEQDETWWSEERLQKNLKKQKNKPTLFDLDEDDAEKLKDIEMVELNKSNSQTSNNNNNNNE